MKNDDISPFRPPIQITTHNSAPSNYCLDGMVDVGGFYIDERCACPEGTAFIAGTKIYYANATHIAAWLKMRWHDSESVFSRHKNWGADYYDAEKRKKKSKAKI